MLSFSWIRTLEGLRRPPSSSLRASSWALGAGIFLVILLLIAEALFLFGTMNLRSVSLLRRFADIPTAVTDEIGTRLIVGLLGVYGAVALYFGLGCALLIPPWKRGGSLPSRGRIIFSVALVFVWVLSSAAARLLAVHPYAASAIPGGEVLEPTIRSFWTPTWATFFVGLLSVLLLLVLARGRRRAEWAKTAVLLGFFFPLLGPSISSLSVEASTAAPSKAHYARPPVVLIGVDSLRRDHVGRFGGPSGLTPHLDEFLASSYEFSNAWTVVGRTHPSYVSMLTARTPDRHGVRYNRADPFFARRLPKTVGHALIDAGYTTRYLTDENMFSSLGIEHGFQRVGQPPTMLETYATRRFMEFFFLSSLPAKWTKGLIPALEHNRALHHNYDSKDFSDAVISAIDEERAKGGPFFVAAHICIAHFPGTQPGPEYRAHQPDGEPIIDYFKASLSHVKDGEMHVSRDRSRRLLGLYRAGVRRADAELGRIFEHLKRTRLFDDAWVIVWSDHGETFADSRGNPILPSHGLAVDEGGEDLKIVLGIRPPGGAHRHVKDTVSSVDIAPTLLAGLGLPALPGRREGRSLLPLTEDKELEEPILYAESGTHFGRKLDESAASYDFDLLRLYHFDEMSGELVTRRHFHDKLVLNKQRMVQLGDLRLVYEPMVDGSRRRRLIDWKEGKRPAPDITSAHPEEFELLNAALEAHLVDQEPQNLAQGVKKDELKSVWLPWLEVPDISREKGRSAPR